MKFDRDYTEDCAQATVIPKEIATEFDCEIIEIRDRVITARSNNGFVLKLRLKSLSGYAYNILAPNGTALSRIDATDHHSEINYGPDHVHAELTRRKRNRVEFHNRVSGCRY
jgi:Family of unknown function (DUF6516)